MAQVKRLWYAVALIGLGLYALMVYHGIWNWLTDPKNKNLYGDELRQTREFHEWLKEGR